MHLVSNYIKNILFSKYFFFPALFLLLVCFYVFYSYNVSTTNKKSILRIGTDGTYPPHSFHEVNAQGNLKGFDIDLIKEVTRRLNLEPQFFETKVNNLISGIDTNRYDILVNVTITDMRKKIYDFSIPYISHDLLLIVRNDEKNINSFADIEGKRVVQISGTYLLRIAKELKSNLLFSDSVQQSLQILLSGRAEATMTQDIPFFHFIKSLPSYSNLLKIADRKQDKFYVAYMMRKGNDKLKKTIDKTLCEIYLDGTYDKIFKRYFEDSTVSYVSICRA